MLYPIDRKCNKCGFETSKYNLIVNLVDGNKCNQCLSTDLKKLELIDIIEKTTKRMESENLSFSRKSDLNYKLCKLFMGKTWEEVHPILHEYTTIDMDCFCPETRNCIVDFMSDKYEFFNYLSIFGVMQENNIVYIDMKNKIYHNRTGEGGAIE